MELDPLISHLENQLRSVGELLACLDTQRDAALKKDVAGVMNSVFALQAELAKRIKLEEERGELLTNLGRELNLAPQDITLEKLLAGAHGEKAEKVKGHSRALRHLLEEVEERYRTNRAIIRQELQFAEHMLEALGEPSRTGAYFQPEAERSGKVIDLKK